MATGVLDVSGIPTLSLCLTSSVRHPRQEWMKRTLGVDSAIDMRPVSRRQRDGGGEQPAKWSRRQLEKCREIRQNSEDLRPMTSINIFVRKIHVECWKTPVTERMWEWCAGVRAKERIIPEVSPAFNDDERVCRPTVAEQKQQQAYFQPCKSNYLKSAFPKSVCNTHEACLCITPPPFTMFTIRSPITVIRLGLRICDWSIKICCD